MTVRRVAVLVAVLVVGAVLAIAFSGTEVAGRPSVAEHHEFSDAEIAAMCRSQGKPAQVFAFFSGDNPDAAMQAKAEELSGDERLEKIEQETQAQAYERFKEIFANQPELIELARPESMPASVILTPVDGLTATALMADLEDELTGPEVDSMAVNCLD